VALGARVNRELRRS